MKKPYLAPYACFGGPDGGLGHCERGAVEVSIVGTDALRGSACFLHPSRLDLASLRAEDFDCVGRAISNWSSGLAFRTNRRRNHRPCLGIGGRERVPKTAGNGDASTRAFGGLSVSRAS